MRNTTNEEKLENVLVALAMLDELPDEKLATNLCEWQNDQMQKSVHTCGAAACFGGWIALTPYFREKYGIRAASGRGDTSRGAPRTRRQTDPVTIGEKLFGVGDAFDSNETRWDGPRARRSDRTVIKQRLKRAFNALTK